MPFILPKMLLLFPPKFLKLYSFLSEVLWFQEKLKMELKKILCIFRNLKRGLQLVPGPFCFS